MKAVFGWIVGVLATIAIGVAAVAAFAPAGSRGSGRRVAIGVPPPVIVRVLPVDTTQHGHAVPSGGYNVPFQALVAPGRTQDFAFHVPVGLSYAMKGYVESLVGSAQQTGEAQLVLDVASPPDQQILEKVSLAQLRTTFLNRLDTSIVIQPRGSLVLEVACAPGRFKCAVGLLVFGALEPAASD